MTRIINLSDLVYFLHPLLSTRGLFALTRAYARFQYYASHQARAVVTKNLMVNFGERYSQEEIERMARRFFEHRQHRTLLLHLYPRLKPRERERLIPFEGLEYLDHALDQNKGVILLGSHLNSLLMFVGIMALRDKGYDIFVALPTNRDPYAPTLVGRLLNHCSVTDRIGGFYGQFNIRPIVKLLKDNKIIAQTGDGLHSARFVNVEFLGRVLPFTTGSMAIAQKTGSLVIPFFVAGAPPDRLRFVFEEPFTIEQNKQSDEVLHVKVSRFAHSLEKYLLEEIPAWEHWLIEDVFNTIATWPQRSLREKYAL